MGEGPDGAAKAGADAGASSVRDAGGSIAVVHVRCSNGNKFTVEVDLSATVMAMKVLLVERSEIPADQQRLIYKGRVLKDDSTLNSYGLQSDHTVHLVRGAAPAPAAGTPTLTSTPTPAVAQANPVGLGSVAGLGGMGFPGIGLGSGGGAFPPFGTGASDFQQMREIIDRNPDLAHILNDPGTLRQTLDAARNPELMREMMRNTDRAMSNIEASPEGFNMLRRMYENVQEPLLNAATMSGEVGNGVAPNPFAALVGMNGAAQGQGQGAANNTGAGTTVPNTAPLPNPWNPTPAGTGTRAAQTPPAVPAAIPGGGFPDFSRLAGLGLPDLGTMGGSGGLMDPAMIQQMLQNPQIQEMMQGILSNPAYMNQIMNMQPQLRAMLNQNPHFRDMMQNPDFIRQMINPESLQQLMQLQQAMMGQRGGQLPGQFGQPGGGLGGAPNMNMDALHNMLGGLDSTAPSNPDMPPEELYVTQLRQLREMGFDNTQDNIQALRAAGGNVHAAVDRLLGNIG
uniref:Uncharacterized protein n=1 Tax=Physcomitrium patens TaxID=3218 RepID=A0A7I4EFD6_PHYPA